MTEFVIKLLRLRGDEAWSEWGAQWWDRADVLGDLPEDGPGGWQLLDHFKEKGRRGTQLDWGALLFPVSRRDLIEIYSDSARLRQLAPGSGAKSIVLSELLKDEKYGLVVVECS